MFFQIIFCSFLFLVCAAESNSSVVEESGTDFVKFTKANIKTENVSRCDDFYTHACGNWKNNEMILNPIRNLSTIDLAEFKIDVLIKEFLQSSTPIDDNTAEGKAKQFYSSCIKMSKQVRQSVNPITSVAFGKLPKGNGTENSWINVNFAFNEYGVNPFMKLEVSHRKKEISIQYQKHEWFPKIVSLIKIVVPQNTIFSGKFYEYLPKFEQFHTELKSFSEINSKQEPEILSLDEFIAANNQTNWTYYFGLALKGTIDNTWKIRNYLNNSTQYNDFLEKTDIIVTFSYASMKLLSEYINMFEFQFPKSLERSCVHLTKVHFGPALMPWLIEKTMAIEWREDVTKIIERITKAFELRVINNFWLDEETKSGAKAKLSAMKFVVGFTDEMKNRTVHDIAYEYVNITTDYWQNLLSLKQKEVNDSKMNIEIPKISLIEAEYFPKMNIFSIPLLYTQMPFYHRNYSDLMKIGGLGFTIGYQMASGFNTENYKLNGKGEVENWWTEGSLKNYTERNECLKSQLSSLTYNNISLIDRINLAEIVANDLGARIAQDAYFKLMEEQSNGEMKMHGDLDLTNKQMYFMQFAQTMCAGNVDAIEPLRVNGILRNKPEFSEAFQCPAGSEKMCP